MFQGQPKRPKYKVGDTVHLVDSPVQPAPAPQSVKSSTGDGGRQGLRADEENNKTSSNISESTAYKVTALHASRTDKRQHQYELTPLEPLVITTTEANMIPASFLPGDIVTPINSAAASEDYYRVKAITIKEDAALLSSKIGYGATPGRPVRDDGEYELLENLFAGGPRATQHREATGTNLGGTQRTSLGRAKVEERVKVVLTVVDGCGMEQEMDASMVRKLPLDEEWKFVQLEKFMGQD